MKGEQTSSFLKYLIYSRPLIVLLVVLAVWLGRAVWDLMAKEEITRVEKEKLAGQAAELEERLDFLASEVARLETDRGVEEEIREKLGLAKPGERVINILPTTEPSTGPPPVEPGSWWQALFDGLAGLWKD